uniref:SCP domain-containing protein n=1 Tax=Ascaris lumbricoides TaxID=6252 RepID=A0A9J2PXY1_ASCLU
MRTCERCVQTTVPSAKGTRTTQTTISPREEPTATAEQGRTTTSPREEPTTTPEEEGPTTEAEEEVPTTQPSGTKRPAEQFSFLKQFFIPYCKITFFSGTAKAVSCRNVHDQKFTPENRKVVVDKHNELRSALVKGNVRDARGVRLEGGRNIYELRWDCRLEEVAQKWADTCKYGHSTSEYRNKAGENIYMWSRSDKHDSIDTNTLKATQLWWDEIKLINMTSAEDYIMSDKILGVAGHWSQSEEACTTVASSEEYRRIQFTLAILTTAFYCRGNYFNRKIYQFGNGCTQDLDCTTYTNSTCNTSTKLCM